MLVATTSGPMAFLAGAALPSPPRARPRACARRRTTVTAVVTPGTEPGPPAPAAAVPRGGGQDEDSSVALEREAAGERYLDLRTLKKAAWRDVRVAPHAPPGCRFGPFSSAAAVAALGEDVLFGPDTVALSGPQRAAVRALLSRRSVLYPSALPDREAVVSDLALRAREWRETIVFCAPCDRAAEAMVLAVCAMGLEERHAVLDLGRGSAGRDAPAGAEAPALVVTVPRVLRRAIVDMSASWWMRAADLVVLDDILAPSVDEWEEIILGMPNRVLLCIFATELSSYEEDELPLWVEAVQNSVVPVSLPANGRFLERIIRPGAAPLPQAYIFNAAQHAHPLRLSLSRVLDELEKELSSSSLGSTGAPTKKGAADAKRRGRSHPAHRNIEDILALGTVDYSQALLTGVESIAAEDVTVLCFEKEEHAMYADFASLVLADGSLTTVPAVPKQRSTKKRRKTAATLANAALKRKQRKESALLPAIMFAHGSAETEAAAMAVSSSLEDASLELVCDPDAREMLSSVLDSFVEEHEGQLTAADLALLDMLVRGIGVVHKGILPALSSLAEELFREALVPVLCVDSHLDVVEVIALPRARSVLVQSCVLSEDCDPENGLIKGSLLGTLAGRPGIDEVGNVVGLWYDNDVVDAEACEILATSLLTRELTSRKPRSQFEHDTGTVPPAPAFGVVEGLTRVDFASPYLLSAASVRNGRIGKRKSGSFLTTYSGLLGALRRHGSDGYARLADFALDSYRGWLVGASVRATREKVEVQQRAVDQHLEDVRWDELARHDRLEAKLNEEIRMYRAMSSRRDSVLRERTLSVLKGSEAGTLIGLCSSSERFLPKGSGGSFESQKESSSDITAAGSEFDVSDELMVLDPSSDQDDGESLSKDKRVVPAILATVLDSKSAKKLTITNSDEVVLCILADGMWTLVPVEDVVAYSTAMTPVANVDLIPVPHVASFDKDPVTQWAKCKPVAEAEQARVSSVAEELVSSITSSSDPLAGLQPFPIPEFTKQENRVKAAQAAYNASPWRGREDQITDYRRLRRRALELEDDARSLRVSEARIDESLGSARSELDSRLHAKLAVLEDCNSVSVPSPESLEMTPIGALASVLPCRSPLFAAACILLLSGLEELTVGQLGALVHIVTSQQVSKHGMPNFRQGRDSDMFDSILQTPSDLSGLGKDELASTAVEDTGLQFGNGKALLPLRILDGVEEIRQALHVVQSRHFDAESLSKKRPHIAPEQRVEVEHGRVICDFLDGHRSWVEIAQGVRASTGSLVRTFRNCAEAVHTLSSQSVAHSELASLQPSFETIVEKFAAWPVSVEDDWRRLVKQGLGVPAGRKKKLSYKAWWERSADAIETAEQEAVVMVETAVAEIVGIGDEGETS